MIGIERTDRSEAVGGTASPRLPPRSPRFSAPSAFPFRAFSIIELLIVVALIAVLLAMMLPALAASRAAARAIACSSNLHSLGAAWTLYAGDYADRAMPLAYFDVADIGSGEQVFWWGTHGTSGSVDHDRGFIAPYLDAPLAERGVFECPDQPWGTYTPQGPAGTPTSTYGYNGYYLSPAKTPGWASAISHRPWRRLSDIQRPTDLLVFADALLAVGGGRNTALLDPPWLFDGSAWAVNPYPSTVFRHSHARGQSRAAAIGVRADASAHAVPVDPAWLTDPALLVGSVGKANDPHYVPDWREW